MDKKYRIRTEVGTDKNIVLDIKKDTEQLEILSLKLTQRELYQSQSSDYGIIVGRVLANGGVGIPNVRVSVFIPLDSNDANNPEILSIYPYLNVTDTNDRGTRYNLLTRVKILDRFSGWLSNKFGIGFKPKTPVGTFPSKEEILSNQTVLQVYKKYYKYSTVTNESGDYMLYGVPVGLQTVHIDCDYTDIGRYSMSPVVLQKKLNLSPDLFENNGTTIRKSDDLSEIPNIESQDINVNVIPLWGNEDGIEAGITRLDAKLRGSISTYFTLFGSAITMGKNDYWGDRIVFRLYLGLVSLCFRILGRTIKLRGILPFIRLIPRPFSNQPNTITRGVNDEEPFIIRLLPNNYRGVCSNQVAGLINCGLAFPQFNTKLWLQNHRNANLKVLPVRYRTNSTIINGVGNPDEMEVVDNKDYTFYTEDGVFAGFFFCNRDKKITDEFGNLVPSPNDDGIFTSFNGYMLFETTDEIQDPPSSVQSARVKMKIPSSLNPQFRNNQTNTAWRRESFNFEFGELYSVAQFYGGVSIDSVQNDACSSQITQGANWGQAVGVLMEVNRRGMVGNRGISNVSGTNTGTPENTFSFEWLNFCLYFYQFMYRNDSNRRRTFVSNLFMEREQLVDNDVLVAPNTRSTQFYLKGENFPTTFVKVEKRDYINIVNNIPKQKGFRGSEIPLVNVNNYKNTINQPNETYFFRGLGGADCIGFTFDRGLLN